MDIKDTLTLMISFTTMVVLILSFHNKKQTACDKVNGLLFVHHPFVKAERP